jgi:hypothetical protein
MGKERNPSKAATLEGRGTLARLLRTIEWLFGMVHESFHLRLSYVMTHIRQLIVFVFFLKISVGRLRKTFFRVKRWAYFALVIASF